MLAAVRPIICSKTHELRNWRWRIMFRMLGMYSSIVSRTVSPNSSRRSSHVPFRRLYGAYWMKQDMMCFPGGARVGASVEGTHMSTYGRCEEAPYFASSYAFSM